LKPSAGLAAADWAVIAALLLGVLYFSRRASGEGSRLPGPTGPEGMPPPGPV